MNRKLLLLSIGIVFLLTSCTLAPKYRRSEAPIPGDWPSGAAYRDITTSSGAPAPPELGWQEFFADERLQRLIERALNNNRDLRVAALNVERARALYGIQRAELFPVVNAVGSLSKERIPADSAGFPVGVSGAGDLTIEQSSVNLGISSWEIDFFGRIRSLKKQALEEYLATEQARRSAQILLVSTVANAYLTLAADRQALNLGQSTQETQQAAYDLIKRRYEVGLANELDLRQAQTQVDTARGDVARFIQQAAQDENALNLLLGSPAPKELLPVDLNSVISPREISPGMSSEVLLRRPDILQAENLLKAAHANIGVVRAAFFPRVTLTTTVGTASDGVSGLFKSGSGAWSYAPQIILPIFDARTWSAFRESKAEREIALAQYEKAIQVAFREVSDALAVKGTVTQQIAAQQSLVNAVAETYRLSNARYTKGIDSYLSVLDAQRSLYAAQQGLISLRLAGVSNLVTVYRVLGGGDK